MPVKWHGDKLAKAVRLAAGDAVAVGAITWQREQKRLLSRVGTGKRYRRPTRIHIASAAGRPPVVDTGNLRRSVQVDLSDMRARNPKARTGTKVKYARWLEFGTRNMAPRPSWRKLTRKPIIDRVTKKVLIEFDRGLRRRVKR